MVNLADLQSQCYLSLPFSDLGGGNWMLRDLLSTITYKRSGDGLDSQGLYLDISAWSYHVFDLTPTA